MLSLLLKDDSSSSNNDLLTLMMLSGGMGGQMGGQMNPLMLSLLLGDDVPKSKAAYDKICDSNSICAAEVSKIYNADGSKVGASDPDVKTAHDAIMKFDTSSSSSSSMSDLLLLSMMSGGGMQGGMQGMLPLL